MAHTHKPRLAMATVVAMACLAALAALAFASGGEAGDGVLGVELRDGRVTVEPGESAPGPHVVEVRNLGAEEHELVVVRTTRAASELPVGLHGVDVGLAGRLVVGEDHAALGHDHREQVTGLLPGERLRQQVELSAGEYVVFCQTANHYLAGERAELLVERTPSS